MTDWPETVEALHFRVVDRGDEHISLTSNSVGDWHTESEDVELLETRTYVPVDALEELVAEWEGIPADGRTAHIFEMCADDLESVIEVHSR